MATHSSVLAWRIPGTGEPGGLPSMGSHRVRHDWSDLAAAAVCRMTLTEFPPNFIYWPGIMLLVQCHSQVSVSNCLKQKKIRYLYKCKGKAHSTKHSPMVHSTRKILFIISVSLSYSEKWKWNLLSHVWLFATPLDYRVYGILQAVIVKHLN